jgi:hypothetical protein
MPFMTQKATIAVLLAALLTAPALAAPPLGPLAPGGPAGSENAQLSSNQTIFIGAAVLVIGLGIYLASGHYGSSGSSSSGGGINTSPPTTTTTQ